MTNCVCEESTDTKETFNDESKRRTSDMNLWNSIWQIENSSNALMIIPNRGLTYPFGEFKYGESIPSQRYNYNNLTGIRYYYREFWGQFPDVKYGGTFKFTGLTKEAFLHNDFVL
jgi:hypothetical protein